MRGKKLLVLLISTGLVLSAHAQEIQARITINSSRVSSQIDKKVFQTLQTALHNFLNNRKWTNETFQQNEKINCNFLLNINQAGDGNIYKASLTVQAARPVYNTSYETPLINFMDESVTFKYVEYQQVEFNENRVGGSDGLASNLSATLAFYVYIILGLDFDSFTLRGCRNQKNKNLFTSHTTCLQSYQLYLSPLVACASVHMEFPCHFFRKW